MPLQNITMGNFFGWNLQYGTPTGFNAATQNDSLQYNLSNVNIATWNQLYSASLTIAPSATTTIDLTNFVNLVQETVAFAHVLSIFVMPTGSGVSIAPGSSNGLTWFLGGTIPTITIDKGGVFMWSDPGNATGTVVNSSHKTLAFTNTSGSLTLTLDVQILGSTS
jgi:hypothetical protein